MSGDVKNWYQEVVPHYRETGSQRYSLFIINGLINVIINDLPI